MTLYRYKLAGAWVYDDKSRNGSTMHYLPRGRPPTARSACNRLPRGQWHELAHQFRLLACGRCLVAAVRGRAERRRR